MSVNMAKYFVSGGATGEQVIPRSRWIWERAAPPRDNDVDILPK